MDRMNPLDASFLHIEDGINHMHIASLAVFEGPAPAYDELVDAIAAKLPLVPRYRQKVRFVPGALGRPVWVDDPHFNLTYHFRHTALPTVGSVDDLRALMGRLMSQELDRHRPLWETWMVEGLGDGHWGLISKVHHCMVDGVSGTDLMSVLLDPSPEPAPPPVDDWEPAPEPSDLQLVGHALAELVRSPYEMGRRLRAAVRTPRRALTGLVEALDGLRLLGGRLLTPNEPLSIEGTIGPHRRWAYARSTLEEVRQVREVFGGTVNDVVLAAITRGFRDLLAGRGELHDGLVVRTLVPVSVRAPDDHTYNNQVAALIAELPVSVADPVERLEVVKRHMAQLKASHMAHGAEALSTLADFAPPMAYALGLRAAWTVMRTVPQRSVNTVTTNVPGPRHPLYACGREMLEYFPYVPLSQGTRVGVAILSYNGRLGFGITGDWDTAPDIDVLAGGIEDGMAELVKAARAA